MMQLSRKNVQISLAGIMILLLIFVGITLYKIAADLLLAIAVPTGIGFLLTIVAIIRLKLNKLDWYREEKDRKYKMYLDAYKYYQDQLINERVTYLRFVDNYIAKNRMISYSVDSGGNHNIDECNEKNMILNQIFTIIIERKDLVDKYFNNPTFNYKDYLSMHSDFNTTEKPVSENECNKTNTCSNSISLRKKVLIFESLFNICNVDLDIPITKRTEFIRNLLGSEPNTKRISDTNIYKLLGKNSKSVNEKNEIKALISDKEYVVEQLKLLGLEKECELIKNEIKDLKETIN